MASDEQQVEGCCRLYCMAICLGVMILLISSASTLREEAEIYEESATQEICMITGYTTVECEYECDCEGFIDIGCDGYCDGVKYSYTAIAPSKCGDQELLLDDHDVDVGGCPQVPYQIGFNRTCHVLECEDAEFTFIDTDERASSAIAFILCAVIAGCYFCWCCGTATATCLGLDVWWDKALIAWCSEWCRWCDCDYDPRNDW